MRRLVVFGLSISSSWGNGHATTYRGLLAALARRGWEITFFEHDVEWYRAHRDLPRPEFCDLRLYADWGSAAVRAEASSAVREADAVLVGSYVAHGTDLVQWLDGQPARPRFFYDIDTPITLTAFQQCGAAEYLRADQVPTFNVYFSFTGGPALDELERTWGAQQARALYCGVDESVYRPHDVQERFACAVGYMGTYAVDRQPGLERLLLDPARRNPGASFILAGAQYPQGMRLPPNVRHIQHLYPADHAAFYSSCGLTLNLTRSAMVRYGWSPSVRLFEAAACGACIVSDTWGGLSTLFQEGREILLTTSGADVQACLALTDTQRQAIGEAARHRVLAEHTYERRAEVFEDAVDRSAAVGATVR
ncbi:MAG: glycosyltransferase [Chloroflexi bacterium]|nr:glycosyltransferase [Chloroflexota bacterium]